MATFMVLWPEFYLSAEYIKLNLKEEKVDMNMDTLQSLFDALPESAVLLDKTGRIIDWNPGATSLFGYFKKEVLGKSLNLIYQHNYPFHKIIQETLPQQKKWTSETRYIRKNGIKGLCKTCASLISPSSHYKAAAIIIHQDISTYKAIETDLQNNIEKLSRLLQEQIESYHIVNNLFLKSFHTLQNNQKILHENKLLFDLLVENTTDVISRHAPDGTYLYASPSSKTLLGYKPEELLNCNLYKFIHYDDVKKLKKIFNQRKGNSNHQIVAYRLRRKEGDYRWFESNIRMLYDTTKKSIHEIQAASRDITDRILDKKARLRGQQLAHVSRLSSLEEMASGMAHEISQPLAAIVNYTQGCVRYLQNKQHDPTQVIEIMKKAVIQAQRAGEVIHRLKNFFCKGQILKTPCKINKLIRETVTLIRNDLNTSKTKIEFGLSKNVQVISADKIQMQQVLLNLIQNSIDAMQKIDYKLRKIHIQTQALDANSIEVTVHDTGPGFSKDMIYKVFEPFFTTKAHGRGIGLAICRSIVEAHGGQFIINPNTNNHSWIRFILPIN
ncbi:MAG: fixL 2 [Gammaproteobacteria bacterium]|jgi:PAS domain S-box-containing protein|nr:fixL 2 [Gammaproteobacteria bacterium]